ncbi:MAG: peptidoglycan editing factor PgeF [Endomicrobium sp.]|jgi:YfiH family protein|nr:peptidoglycan editing factor PgeF [Endomicrobium sp.]
MKEKLISEKNFPAFHFTTTKPCGNMKNETDRNVLLHSLGLNGDNLVLAKQAHTNIVRVVTAKDKGQFIDDCDGLITADKNIITGIFTADCMPVLMISKDKSVKAAVHAGRKGLANAILQNAVKIFKEEFDINPETISVYIGPHIKECCYEVSADFENVFGTKLKNGRLDLSAIARKILEKEGVREILVSERCTCCENNIFFSYRKDRTDSRMLTVLA